MSASVSSGSTSEMAPTKVVLPTPKPPLTTIFTDDWRGVLARVRGHGPGSSRSVCTDSSSRLDQGDRAARRRGRTTRTRATPSGTRSADGDLRQRRRAAGTARRCGGPRSAAAPSGDAGRGAGRATRCAGPSCGRPGPAAGEQERPDQQVVRRRCRARPCSARRRVRRAGVGLRARRDQRRARAVAVRRRPARRSLGQLPPGLGDQRGVSSGPNRSAREAIS